MALATDQDTPIEWSLTRLFRYLRAELGKGKKRALDEMEYRREEGHLRVIVREYDADGKPQGDPFDLPTDKAHELVYDRVWIYPRGLKLGHRCTVTEKNVRDLWPTYPPASQTASDQQPEELPGSDPTKPLSTPAWMIAEARRLKATGKISEGTRKTEFAKLLAQKMGKAVKNGEVKKSLAYRSIRNELCNWGLWPISSIKIS
jgi:hypothetical protein